MTRPGAILVALSLLAAAPHAASTGVVRHFTSRDQQTGRYQYVPFDVPAGTTEISVSYRYDSAAGTNVVDLGLFEPGSLALGSKAFRGWSGGAQTSIRVGVHDASPGYWPGPIPAGRWHVALGLYKVGASGVDVETTIAVSSAPADGGFPVLASRATAPIRRGAAWYAGALHMHTTNSDGALTPQQLADKAVAEKLDFIAITDHNNTVHQLAAIDAPGLLVITGEEVTTPGGHFSVWGLGGARDYIDFRILPGDPAIASAMRAARARGALVSINHPVADCVACSWTHELPDSVNAIEIANGAAAARQQAMTMWDILLRAGRHVTAVGESDWHRGNAPLGAPSVRVWAPELSTRAVLDALRAGRVVVMADATTPPPTMTVRSPRSEGRVGDTVRVKADEPLRIDVEAAAAAYKDARVQLLWNGEAVDAGVMPASGRLEFQRFSKTAGYFRVHVSGADGAPLAVTNPVFVDIVTK